MASRAAAWGAYRIITDSLRARIASGEFSPGGLLPSEAAFAAEYHVARNTMRRVLGQLAAERLITARPGRGHLVIGPGEVADMTPMYRRIATDFRTAIETGTLRAGEMLPSEAALMTRYGVARGTARQALAELAGAGLIETVRGKGRCVLER